MSFGREEEGGTSQRSIRVRCRQCGAPNELDQGQGTFRCGRCSHTLAARRASSRTSQPSAAKAPPRESLLFFAVRQAIISGLVILTIVGWTLWNHRADSSAIREAAYQRYADLPDQPRVQWLVDESHDDCFSACYVPGDRSGPPRFDHERYVVLMDERVRWSEQR